MTNDSYTTEQMVRSIIEAYEQTGRPPTQIDDFTDVDGPQMSTMQRRTESFALFRDGVLLRHDNTYVPPGDVQAVTQRQGNNGQPTNRKIPEQELRDSIVAWYVEYGEAPSVTDITEQPGAPSAPCYYDRFDEDSWSDICNRIISDYQARVTEAVLSEVESSNLVDDNSAASV